MRVQKWTQIDKAALESFWSLSFAANGESEGRGFWKPQGTGIFNGAYRPVSLDSCQDRLALPKNIKASELKALIRARLRLLLEIDSFRGAPMTPEEFMARAIGIGREGLHEKHARPFAAVIVKEGQIVGEGRSQQNALNDPTAHGEIVAIRDACRRLGTTDLSGCELYTTCEPCLMCASAIWWAKISKMYYAHTQEDCEQIGFSTKGLVDEVTRPLGSRKLPAKRICAAEANMLFREWAASPHFKP